MASRSKYWSLSPVASWLRKVGNVPPMPSSGTSREWSTYHAAAKAANPFMNWVADDVLDGIQNFLCWPYDKIRDATYWFNRHYVQKQQYLDTGLDDEYIEVDRRILFGLFNTLVQFVNCEKAWMEYICNSDKYKDVLPFYKRNWPFRHFTRFNYPELALTYLKWEASLTQDDDWFGYSWRIEGEPEAVAKERAENKNYGTPTYQAAAAIEIMELYNWWKNIRPLRKDPLDESGWSDYCDKQREKDGNDLSFLDHEDETPEEKEHVRAILDLSNKLEETQDQEDEDMMIRLIKVRQSMWT